MAIPREDWRMNTNQKIRLTNEERSYIAGFLDGDGCILAQIVWRKDYRLGFQIRLGISFYQKTSRHWFMLWLKSKLHYGSIRKRNDGMSEYTIVGTPVKEILLFLCSRLHLKHKLAQHILSMLPPLSTMEPKSLWICIIINDF